MKVLLWFCNCLIIFAMKKSIVKESLIGVKERVALDAKTNSVVCLLTEVAPTLP